MMGSTASKVGCSHFGGAMGRRQHLLDMLLRYLPGRSSASE
jgi:hypothetical protein